MRPKSAKGRIRGPGTSPFPSPSSSFLENRRFNDYDDDEEREEEERDWHLSGEVSFEGDGVSTANGHRERSLPLSSPDLVSSPISPASSPGHSTGQEGRELKSLSQSDKYMPRKENATVEVQKVRPVSAPSSSSGALQTGG
jgi:hypothetical protein